MYIVLFYYIKCEIAIVWVRILIQERKLQVHKYYVKLEKNKLTLYFNNNNKKKNKFMGRELIIGMHVCLNARLIEIGFISYSGYKCAGKRGFAAASSGLARAMLSFAVERSMLDSLDGKLQLKP